MYFFLENTEKFVLESEKKGTEQEEQKVYGKQAEEENLEQIYRKTYDRLLEAIEKYQGKYAEEQIEKLLSFEENLEKKKILIQAQKSVRNLDFEEAELIMKGNYDRIGGQK